MKKDIVTVAISSRTREKIKEIAKAQHRAMKGAVELMVNDKYKELFKNKGKN